MIWRLLRALLPRPSVTLSVDARRIAAGPVVELMLHSGTVELVSGTNGKTITVQAGEFIRVHIEHESGDYAVTRCQYRDELTV